MRVLRSPWKTASTLLVLVLLTPQLSFAAGQFANGVFVEALCNVIYYMGGSMGAMLFASALLIGVIGATFGNLRPVISSLGVAIGSFCMYSVMTMYFPAFPCQQASGGRAGAGGGGAPKLADPMLQSSNGQRIDSDMIDVGSSWNSLHEESD